jgi:RimJ/RimL family protein N-acetyltransferase
MYETFYARIGDTAPWLGYFILRDEQVVGTCGFAGQPAEGCVEIAYWTFPEFEGQGIAFAASGALIRITRAADPALAITAKTAPEPNASSRILEKHGFARAGIVQDHEIGDAWLWRLDP